MRKKRSVVVAAIAAWLVFLPGAFLEAAHAGGSAPARAAAVAAPAAPTDPCSTFFDNDRRLGPATYPTTPPMSSILLLYNRFGGATEQQFLNQYWDPTAGGGAGGWRYPPDDGFLILFGRPVESVQTLLPGVRVDRFGSEFGAFLAPIGTLYTQRAIPPQSLDTFDPNYPCNYHEYKVTKAFKVLGGPIAPWFNQLGLGFQDKLDASLVPSAPVPLSVKWLIDNGYLSRLN